MDKDFERLFSHINAPEPPDWPLGRIVSRINEKKKINLIRQKLALASIGFLGSIFSFLPALNLLSKSLNESGFLDFISLIFSDAGTVLVLWKTFYLSLLETLPVVEIILFSAVLLVFLESLRYLSKNLKEAGGFKSLIIN